MSPRLMRRLALLAGASALVGMGTLTACGSTDKPADEPSPSPSSSSSSASASASASPTSTATLSPSEKSVPGAITPGPQDGSGPKNSFSPTVTARPVPNSLPGNVVTGG